MWSPDGSQLASASDDRTVCVWDASTWREVARMEGLCVDCDDSTCCAWSPDGARLASSSDDNAVRVWLAPAETPTIIPSDDQANNASANVPDLSLEAAANQRLAREAEVANKRARRLEGDPEALSECSLEELRQVGRCSITPG